MQQRKNGWVAFVLITVGLVTAASAAKQEAKSHAPQTIAKSPTARQIPSVLSQEGVIAGRYPYGTPPRLLVTGTDGKNVILMIDPHTTSISKENKSATLADLQDGDQVSARYTEKDGAYWAQSLQVIQTSELPSKIPSTSPPMSQPASRVPSMAPPTPQSSDEMTLGTPQPAIEPSDETTPWSKQTQEDSTEYPPDNEP